MTLERTDYYRDLNPLREECKKHLNFHVVITMTDGNVFDGIIENVDVDKDTITVLLGEDVIVNPDENLPNEQRQYPGYGYGYPRRRFRRFRRGNIPIALLAALGLLPYPYYPYPPYHPYPPYYPYY